MNRTTNDTSSRLVEQLYRSSRLLHRSRAKAGKLQVDENVIPTAGSTQTTGSDAQQARPLGNQRYNNQSSRSQIKLLGLLVESGVIPMKQIVEVFDIRPSSASELVSKLEARGFATRETDSTDKRASNIRITDEGRKFAEEANAGRSERLSTLFDGLTDDEQEQLVTLLEKLNDSIREKIGPMEKTGRGLGRGCGRAHGHGHGPGYNDHGGHRGNQGPGRRQTN